MPAPEHKPRVAYLDELFIGSDAARPLRILAEYLEPLDTFRREQIKDTIVFFGSARLQENGPLGRYYRDARALARLITEWSMSLSSTGCFVVCSGGGGGIMEAANRGAADAGGRSIGLNISLPHEQRPNPYITPELGFEFHYFFMRKLWFAHLAKALIVFPGGFGTLDELTEIINFKALVRHEVISAEDLNLFTFIDEPAAALAHLQRVLAVSGEEETPAFAHSCHGDS